MCDTNVSSFQLFNINEEKVFKKFETVDLYFMAEFKMTFHFLALQIRSRTTAVQVSTVLHVSRTTVVQVSTVLHASRTAVVQVNTVLHASRTTVVQVNTALHMSRATVQVNTALHASRATVVQVNTVLHVSLCIWILTICRVGAGGGI
jgi:hypothetical protein